MTIERGRWSPLLTCAPNVLVLIFAILLACSTVRSAQDDAKQRIQEIVRNSGAELVAVAYVDLASGRELLINADASFHAASTMKVPVMMEVFRQIGEGKLLLDEQIPVKNDFLSIVDQSHYSLSPDDDSDQSLYKKVGGTDSVRDLIRLMITVSSNLATNILIERVTPTRVMELMRSLGANDIQVLRGVEDGKAFQRGLNNTTTAHDLMIILRRIAEKRAVSPRASEEMIKVMLEQKFNEGIPAGLPASAHVAHKTGSITKANHDAGIVYLAGKQPYILVVLTRGIADESKAQKLISDISRAIYETAAGASNSH
jgi:beta-lactamase class A